MAEEKKDEGKLKPQETAGVLGTDKPSWLKMKPAELEKIVVDLYKQGEPIAKIGLILRDKHGIPKAKLLGKKIAQILMDAKVTLRQENEEITKRMESLKAHFEKNKHDQPAKKKLVAHMWAVKRAKNYSTVV
jgi:small subunit ribosomal protein S15